MPGTMPTKHASSLMKSAEKKDSLGVGHDISKSSFGEMGCVGLDVMTKFVWHTGVV